LSESHKSVVFAIVILLGLVAGLRTACRGSWGKPREPVLEWKCPKCGEVYKSRSAGAGRSLSSLCPKCEAEAQRLIRFHCTRCGHVFEHTVQVGQEGATRTPIVCPKCKDKRVLPDTIGKGKGE